MNVINLDDTNFNQTIESGVVLLDFWAQWCGPCRMIAPVIEELAIDFKGLVNVCKVNTDEEQDIAQRYDIRSIPTIIILKDGEVVETMIGAKSKEEMSTKISRQLKD